MFLLSEEEIIEDFTNTQLSEGFLAYTYGSWFGFYKNKASSINPEKVKYKTDKIDEKMEKKGFKPYNNPSKDELTQLLLGSHAKYNNDKYQGKDPSFSMPNIYSLQNTGYGFLTYNNRKYMYISTHSILVKKQDLDPDKNGNIGAIYPIYKNDEGKLRLGLIWITNNMLKK